MARTEDSPAPYDDAAAMSPDPAENPLESLEREVSADQQDDGPLAGPGLVPRSAQTPDSDVADWARGVSADRQLDVVPPVIGADT